MRLQLGSLISGCLMELFVLFKCELLHSWHVNYLPWYLFLSWALRLKMLFNLQMPLIAFHNGWYPTSSSLEIVISLNYCKSFLAIFGRFIIAFHNRWYLSRLRWFLDPVWFKTRIPSFDWITGLPESIFLKKTSKQHRLSKKKTQKSTGYNRVFDRVTPGFFLNPARF